MQLVPLERNIFVKPIMAISFVKAIFVSIRGTTGMVVIHIMASMTNNKC